MSSQAWYSVRCIFEHHNFSDAGGATTYEERVVILRAESLDDAIQRGEEEANDYAEHLSNVSYTGFIDAFHMFDKTLKDKTEVFSLMRNSYLGRAEYLDHFFDSGTERRITSEENRSEVPPC